MALVYKDNAPVKFITGTYVGYDAENNNCNCFTKPWCQLVERADTTNYQVQVTANSAELVTAGDFSTACGVDWTCGANWAIAAGVATHTAGVIGNLTQPICVMNDRYYRVRFDIDAITGTLQVELRGNVVGIFTTTGSKEVYILPSLVSTDTQISFEPGTDSCTIDNVSIFEFSQIGYEIETQIGTSIFTDIAPIVTTRFEDQAQITVDWTQAATDDCYVICNHDASDYREQICNGEFFEDALWELSGGWSILGGVLRAAGGPAGSFARQTFLHPLKAGRCYTLTFDTLNFGGGVLDILLLPSVGSIGNVSSNGAQSFNIDLTGQPDQTILRFEDLIGALSIDVDNVSILMQAQCFQEDACSECYKLGSIWDCSFLFSWTNDENAFDFEYVGLSFTQFFRHRIKLWQPSYPEQATRFLNSSGTISVLHALSQKIEDLTAEEMPEYLHDAFRLAWIHDTVTIEAVNYTKEEGDYEPNWRKSSLLAPVLLDVRQNGQDNENANC